MGVQLGVWFAGGSVDNVVMRLEDMLTEGAFKHSLMQAVQKCYPDAVRRLLAEGAEAGYSVDVLVADPEDRKFQRTALHAAVEGADAEIVGILLDHGASLEALDSSGRTPLHCAVGRLGNRSGRVAIIEMLLDRGASGHAGAHGGSNETILHRHMMSHGQLISRGAISNGRKRKGLATDGEMLRITRMLMRAGAQPDFTPEGAQSRYRTAFQIAVEWDVIDQVRVLVEEFGVDWSQKTLSKKSMQQIADSDEMRALFLSYKTGKSVLQAIEGNAPSASVNAKTIKLAL